MFLIHRSLENDVDSEHKENSILTDADVKMSIVGVLDSLLCILRAHLKRHSAGKNTNSIKIINQM